MALAEITSPATLSLLQRLEQIEAAIAEAHNHCEIIKPLEADTDSANSDGALGRADTCIERLRVLNERLATIAELTGRL